MTAPLATSGAEFDCDWCKVSADTCAVLKSKCCPDCTHDEEPFEVDGPDIDEIAVERAMNGDLSIRLNSDEVAEAFHRLHAKGYSQKQIAERLGTTARSIDRWANGHVLRPHSRPAGGRTMSTAQDTIRETLDQGFANPSARIRSAAKKAQTALEHLETLLADDAGKRALRERVEKLERELREAKKALGGKPSPALSGPTVDVKAVRAWAIEKGYEVAPIGRVPQAIIEDYLQQRQAS